MIMDITYQQEVHSLVQLWDAHFASCNPSDISDLSGLASAAGLLP